MSIFVFVTLSLPGGSIYGVNFKGPLYLLIIPLAIHSMFLRGLATPWRLAMLLGVPTVFVIWVLIGMANGFPAAAAVHQYGDVVKTFQLCWLVSIFCAEEEAQRLRFLRLVLNAEIAASLLKAGLLGYAVFRGIPTVTLVESLSTIFGVNLMTMDLGAMVGRIQFVSDAVIPLTIVIVLRHRNRLRLGNIRALLTILLLVASTVLSFSRYFWAFTLLAVVVGLMLAERDKFKFFLSGLLALSFLASLPFIGPLYELRFSNDVAGNSDSLRDEQSSALKIFFREAPVMGHGFGSYTNAVIRAKEGEPSLNFSYEEQWLALCGQLGVVGMGVLVLIGLCYYRDLWLTSDLGVRDRVGLGLSLLAWLAAGLYNPLLFNVVTSTNYAIIAVLSKFGHRRTQLANPAPEDMRLVNTGSPWPP